MPLSIAVCATQRLDHGKEKRAHEMRDADVRLVCREPEQFTEKKPIHQEAFLPQMPPRSAENESR